VRHLVLVYTGVSRNSGISNWDIFKRFLDGDTEVRSALQSISDAAQEMRQALLASDWQAAGAALDREWESRKILSPAVTNQRIDGLIAAARAVGALAGKVCGAGGGGCLVLWIGDRGDANEVRRVMEERGAVVLEFRAAAAGVRVTET
jgi:D-glycero-alpha-D-manno-heptose-7-phosphate kinase